ncbi:hypothetical protein M9Y10_001128 [Tritrichomonas musculus]|uniref:Cation-transporting ATPase n=1 Tax=Tritrichomonas musculus TaxID=1915356 RepID=A0ABR2L765_9EUKA
MVKSVFLTKTPFYLRLNVIPFLILFPLTLNPCVEKIKECWIPEEPDWPTNSTFAFIFDHVDVPKLEPYTFRVMLPVFLAFFEVIFLLIPYWSVNIRCVLHFKKSDPEHATHVAFYPEKYKGMPGIVPLIREKNKLPYTVFLSKKREWVDDHWQSIKYPNKRKVAEYLGSNGLTEVDASKRVLYYGENSYTIPIPGFLELLLDQIRTPLFVFQVFSILCYLLDDYWTTPLFSLVSLLFMESATVRTRQSNLLELRGVETPPITLHVKRNGEWKKAMSDTIVPGDLIILDQEVMCPCDLVIISGRAVLNEAMLTGESTPQIKDSCSMLPPDTQLNIKVHKNCVMLGGTNIEQIIPSDEKNLPVNGVVCVVLATGLGSSQGRLIRTILYSSEKISVESKDSYYLLLFLSVFAILASGYLAYYGMKAHAFSTFRLIVETLLILTSTIPPDLPLQTNFQINSSLLALSRLKVFCTEPYRIQFAGMITCCCFDKTGTLTAEEYRLVGVDNLNSPPAPRNSVIDGNFFIKPQEMPIEALRVIGGCHSLIRGKYGQLIGDSLEASAFSSMKYKLMDNEAQHPRANLKILKTFYFSSDLRRMTSLCQIEGEENLFALMKGAPETISELLDEVPENYFDVCRNYTRQGCRVLALAYRQMDNLTPAKYDPHIARKDIECHMKFAGFIIFSAAIKRGSEDTIAELLRTMHRVIIITGDDPLTACHVAKVLHIIRKPVEIHDLKVTNENGEEISADDVEDNRFNDLNKRVLAYTGRCLENANPEEYEYAIRHCNIFARMSPQMKANVVIKLKELGFRTLMCGDGTNDVSALKIADVGCGLVEASEEEKEESALEKMKEADSPQVKLGAASIASPFVSKRPTVSACIDLIRFGRSTLSSTLDMFKQLSLISLVAAYNMSILFVENVRFGERQNLIFSIITSVASMSVAWAVPRRKLSIERPFPSFFNGYLVSSVLLQFGTHLLFLHLTHKLVFENGFKIDKFNYNARFTPNLLNTAMYIMRGEMDIVTICCNYRGAPFMQSFSENRALLIGIILSGLAIAVLVAQIHPAVNKAFQLVPFPNKKFQFLLGSYCVLDSLFCIISEKLCMWYFSREEKDKTKGLVEKDVVDGLSDYMSNDDDIFPEESYEFGLMEMLKSNVKMQQSIKEKNQQAAIRERKKREFALKAEKEVKEANKNK